MTDKGFRYRHSEGITDVGITGEGGKLITCGSDGDIRVYESFDEEEPVTFSASDCCLGLTCFDNKVFVGTENHTVESYELPKGKSLGVKAKFTATVNHVDISGDGKWLVAGSGDMTLQIILLEDGSTTPPRKIEAHRSPVLSVAVDPKGIYVASSGCDGCVSVWFLAESASAKLAKRWEQVFPSSNDISLSPTLCRIAWSPDGQHLAIPQEDKSVTLFSREGWQPSRSYKNSALTKMVSVLRFSNCGAYLAAGGANGAIIVWNSLTAETILELGSSATDKNAPITGITFGATDGETKDSIYFTDDRGRVGFFENFAAKASKPGNDDQDGDVDVFDDGMDDLFDDADNENEISISKIKAQLGFTEDEYVGVEKATKELGIDFKKSELDRVIDDDASSMMSGDSKFKAVRMQMMYPPVNPFTDPQPPFQPSSTPVHLEHRFMVWNNVGIIRSYSTEDDDAIDIEFHDASFHNSVHLRNQFDFILATMSNEVIVLACEKGSGNPSKLFCLNFASWDSSKEWTADMPKDEQITCVAVGTGWVAATTDLNRLRLFSVGGCQKFTYELPGSIVSMSGFEDILFIAYHSGVGVKGNQSIAYSLFKIKGSKLQSLRTDIPLPLTPGSTLTWIGFTDEGTPTFSDSKETFRILNGELWTPFCYMKELLSGQSDHFWIVGASETAQNIRAVKCKGSKYPPTLPRPTLMILDAKIPLCELDTEKSQMEEVLLRAFMLNSISQKMDKKGFEIDEFKEKAEKDIRETLMKLFVISTKGERDLRASEYISLMPSSHAVQVAVKYASRQYRTALVERLTRIGRRKMQEEEGSDVDEDDDFETKAKTNFVRYGNVGPSNSMNNYDSPYGRNSYGLNDSESDYSASIAAAKQTISIADNPLLKKQQDEIRAILNPSSVAHKGNPFRKEVAKKADDNSQSQDAEGGKGIAFIDAWKKPPEKPPVIDFNLKHTKTKKRKKGAAADKDKQIVLPPVATLGKKKQTTLFDMGGKMSKKTAATTKADTSVEIPPNEDSSATNGSSENSEPLATAADVDGDYESIDDERFVLEKKRKQKFDEEELAECGTPVAAAPDPEKKKRMALKLSVFSKKPEEV